MKYLSVILFLLCGAASSAQLLINEVCSKNTSLIEDGLGRTPDFVELINVGNAEIWLGNYFLSDKLSEPLAWQLPPRMLQPDEIHIIWCSGSSDAPDYANFKISSNGETIYLSTNGEVADVIEVPVLRRNHTYGRVPGADEWAYFQRGTPGLPNSTFPSYSITPRPTLPDAGFYDTSLEININGPGALFYTLDGADPREEGTAYTGPFLLDNTTVVRAISREPGKLASEITTSTYIIGQDKYLPVVSITCRPHDLWDEEDGIYVFGADADSLWPHYGANFWDDRKIEANIELFENQSRVVNHTAEIQIHGGKAARNMPQKPFRVTFDEVDGSAFVDHQFIKHKDIHSYRKVVLRNSGGDFNLLHFRDGWIVRHCHEEGLDLDILGFEPTVTYLNGEYWGILNLREKIDEDYCRLNHGFGSDIQFDILEKDSAVIDGSRDHYENTVAFFELYDLTDPEYFDEAASLVDLSSLTDYIIAETFWNNTDWPRNNIKFYRPQLPEGKYRFIMFDLDVSLNGVGYVNEETDNLGRILNEFQETHVVKLLINLLENEDYRHGFINRYADLINTSFDRDYMMEKMLDFLYELEPEMTLARPRWGSSIEWWWSYHIEPRTLKFLDFRSQFARDYVQSNFELAGQYDLHVDVWPSGAGSIALNTITLKEFPWAGIYFDDVPVTLTPIPGPGFTFKHWLIEGEPKSTLPSLNMAFDEKQQITAVFQGSGEIPDMRVFPNPSNGSFNLEFIVESSSQGTIEIVNQQGQTCYLANLEILAGANRLFLDPELSSGIYSLKVRSEEFCFSNLISIQ